MTDTNDKPQCFGHHLGWQTDSCYYGFVQRCQLCVLEAECKRETDRLIEELERGANRP